MTRPLVVIGSSKGGLRALQSVLSTLSADFNWPIAVAQHRERDTSSSLVEYMQKNSALKIREPEDKEQIEGGIVYLAPADYHLLIDDDHFALSTAPPKARARPSIDVLFESAADAFGSRTVGVILTGANSDGASGLRAIKEAGGLAVVEDPKTAECGSMPLAALKATSVDEVLSLAEIAPFLNSLCLGETEVTNAV
ncbi:MAG: two-component system, chemotaxis family, protein-glutamate methylesterase/glutaminase [Blastocatellia bacterium]|nr:two-component system, chemotaxis family, protein-glutamate methylesterase/glutaminase [Blastocatellia bacterium]